ncbi:SGNH/GDSL hydrolase family protein [Parapedobacter sp.]
MKIKALKVSMPFVFGYLVLTNYCLAQVGKPMVADSGDFVKIAASQGPSSPLLFTVPEAGVPLVIPGTFYREDECATRDGIPNFLAKAGSGKDVTVAFIGGSITQSKLCYRIQAAQYMQQLFPDAEFRWVNAGVSGTGTDLGAFRLEEQVLRYQPDLIFIEFAVNGAYQPGMEGMIRQVIKNNPYTDICLIYTIKNGQTASYQRGDIPDNILGLERIASHYAIPSIHLGMEAAELEAQDKLIWKGSREQKTDKLLFSEDGIHPLEAGGNLYAAAIARGLHQLKANTLPRLHTLPDPLISDIWDSAGMYSPWQVASFDNNWHIMLTQQSPLTKFEGWFDSLMTADKPGAACTFYFEGDMFGVFDIGGPEVGQLTIWINDQLVGLDAVSERNYRLYQIGNTGADTTLNRFNGFCNDRYRGQYDVIQLPFGRHKVTLKVSFEKADKHAILGPKRLDDITANPAKYDRSAIYLGRILLRGKPIAATGHAQVE